MSRRHRAEKREVIPDAKLLVVEGMGHDVAPPLWPQIIGALADHAGAHRPD